MKIVEKPDWLSWDEIHEVIWKAHAQNRENGINMAFAALPGSKMEEIINNEGGKMFVAMLDDKVVGTGAIIIKSRSFWWGKDKYAYCCFDSVVPEYRGCGIYKQIELRQEKEAKENGIKLLLFDTHEYNRRMLEINKKNDYKPVGIKVCADHYNIVMVKWLNGCPYSEFYCRCQFLLRKYYKKLRYKPGKIKRFGI